MTNAENAKIMREAILKFAQDETALDNFESYLRTHFHQWLGKYGNTPDDLASEFKEFANMFTEEGND